MTKEENIATLNEHLDHWKRLLSEKICDQDEGEKTIDALHNAIKVLEQEPCDDVCEWFEQYVDIATDIVELRFSDGTVKRAKRGLYMRDIEKSIRKMLIDQIANEKKQDSCEDAISRKSVLEGKISAIISGQAIDVIPVHFIKQLPSVTPQEPKIDMLDKIRSEITAIAINGQVDAHTMFIRTGEQVKQVALEIIDKYKAVGGEG